MARCFACNMLVETGYDKKTDRFYCPECFEPTNKVLLKNLDSEMDALFGTVNEHFLEVDDWITDNLYPTDAEVDIIKDRYWDE